MYYQCQNCDTVFDDYEAERQPEYVGGADHDNYTTILVCPLCGGKDLYENPPDPYTHAGDPGFDTQGPEK